MKWTAHASDNLIGGEMLNGKWMRKGDYEGIVAPGPYGLGVW